jgi:type IV pilus assembly protein PilC
MKFNYLARTQKGEVQTGTIEASNQQAALKALQSSNLIVIKLQAVNKIPLFAKEIKLFKRVSRKEKFVFFRQLAILVGADVPLVQSLKSLGQQSDNAYFKEIVLNVASDVDGGMAFSKALAKYPKIFPVFAVNLIKTGEVAGQLQESLTYLADYLERDYYLVSKVRGAMAYPAFILSAFVVVGILVMVMVIPSLTSILTESGQELPWSTKIVIASSDFIRSKGWIILIIAIVAGFFFRRYKKTKQGRMYWDKFKLKMPVFGKILQKTYLARMADNLSALVRGGVSIIQGLTITAQVVGNAVFEQIILKARDDVRAGRSIHTALAEHDEFPLLFSQMIKTGEETGKLDEILVKLSDFYNKEVENVVNNLSQLIEPILLVFLGIGVSILIFSVFMPIYNLAGGL